MSEILLKLVISRIITGGNLEIAFPSGNFASFGDGTGEPIRIRLNDYRAVWHLALRPNLALGELITDGRLEVLHGSVYDLLDLICRNFAGNAWPSHSLPQIIKRKCVSLGHRRNSLWRAKKNVAHHYDLDGRLYRLFLDEDQQYSCAYFESATTGIDEAQLSKKRHITAKLKPLPNQKVLDIGCGWGGLDLYLARNCGVYVTGVTLSKEQLDVARRRAKEQDLTSQLEFRLEDYRDVGGEFDRIVSVGMFEHVGPSDYVQFFEHAFRLLNNDGIMLLHTIGRLDGPSPTNPWLEKYIFPGSYGPSLSEMLPAIERSGLLITDIEILRLHYAQTLRAWRQRFLQRRTEAAALYDERFCRMWEFYLAGCEASFRYCGLVVFQIQLAKRIDAVPLTRDYIAQIEAKLCEAEANNQSGCSQAAE